MIKQAWRAGHVRRWHTSPEMASVVDTDSAHQHRCWVLWWFLFPDAPLEEGQEVLTHDMGEWQTGDIPPHGKLFFPDVHEIENIARKAIGLEMVPHNADRVLFVDKLDAYLMVQLHRPDLLATGEWRAARKFLDDRAKALGIYEKFLEVMG